MCEEEETAVVERSAVRGTSVVIPGFALLTPFAPSSISPISCVCELGAVKVTPNDPN